MAARFLASRCCWRPTASACATSSICRRWWICSPSAERRQSACITVDSQQALALRGVAALRLHRQLSLRRRRAAGRAPRPGAVHRSVAAARAPRRGASCARCSTPTPSPKSSATPSSSPEYHARPTDALHDLLLRLGDLSLARRSRRRSDARDRGGRHRRARARARRAVRVRVAGEARFIAVEDAARYRDAVGVPLPHGIAGVAARAADRCRSANWCAAYARTHAPVSPPAMLAARYGLGVAVAKGALRRLAPRAGLLEGELPARRHGARVVRPRRAAARPPPLAGRAAPRGRAGAEPHGARPPPHPLAGRGAPARRPRRGAGRVEKLQGARFGVAAGAEILPARVDGYTPGDLDPWSPPARWCGAAWSRSASATAGWRCTSPTTWLPCAPPPGKIDLPELEARVLAELHRAAPRSSGRCTPRRRRLPARDGRRLVDAGLAGARDQRHPAPAARLRRQPQRSRREARAKAPGRADSCRHRPRVAGRQTRSRTGRRPPSGAPRSPSSSWRATAWSPVTSPPSRPCRGLHAIYPVLRHLEETGRVRRGYFVAGLGAAQFAHPALSIYCARTETPAAAVAVTSPPPTPPIPTARWSTGRPGARPRSRPAASPVRASCSWTAMRWRGSAVAIASCWSPCPTRSPSARREPGPSRVSWYGSRDLTGQSSRLARHGVERRACRLEPAGALLRRGRLRRDQRRLAVAGAAPANAVRPCTRAWCGAGAVSTVTGSRRASPLLSRSDPAWQCCMTLLPAGGRHEPANVANRPYETFAAVSELHPGQCRDAGVQRGAISCPQSGQHPRAGLSG